MLTIGSPDRETSVHNGKEIEMEDSAHGANNIEGKIVEPASNGDLKP